MKTICCSSFTFSAWASKDLRLLVTFLSSSSRSLALLQTDTEALMYEQQVGVVVQLCVLVLMHLCVYLSETSARSSARSKSPSKITSLRAT